MRYVEGNEMIVNTLHFRYSSWKYSICVSHTLIQYKRFALQNSRSPAVQPTRLSPKRMRKRTEICNEHTSTHKSHEDLKTNE